MSTDETHHPRPPQLHLRARQPARHVPQGALACGTDIVCADLEDAIAPKDKDEARRIAFSSLATAPGPDRVERIIRMNCLRTTDGMKDVQALLDAPHAWSRRR